MEKQKRNFSFQVHIAIGIMWIIIGAAVISGPASLFWILVGLIFITIGFLAMREQLKRPADNP